MAYALDQFDQGKLNSLTKYPSIETYHDMGGGGRLAQTHTSLLGSERVLVTEKLDGTNGRIILAGNDYLIGSREELLMACGDRVCNPTLDIVETLRPIADRLVGRMVSRASGLPLVAIYGEVYGDGINSRQYGKGRGFRVFDVLDIPLSLATSIIEGGTRETIARWRDHGNQPFLPYVELCSFCDVFGLSMTPLIVELPGGEIPTSHEGVYDWMAKLLPMSQSLIDIGAPGQPEGVVIRSEDRSQIVKLRFQDYERSLRTK